MPEFRYDEPGSLSRPGPIGRAVRLLMGLLCGYAVVMVLTRGSGMITRQDLNEWAWWPVIALALWLFPPVVNIGFGKAWNRWYLTTSMLALGAVTAVIGKVAYGSFLGGGTGAHAAHSQPVWTENAIRPLRSTSAPEMIVLPSRREGMGDP